MISEIDRALRTLVKAEALGGADVEVVLDAPTKEWAARRNAPAVNMYLYDIREDLRRREYGFIEEHGPDGTVVARTPQPRFFKMSYLVTAWTQRPEDEHRLLAALLHTFLRHNALPNELVQGPLAAAGLPVWITVGLPPPEDRGFADVWTALGGELKPSLDVVVTAPTVAAISYPAGPPVREYALFDMHDLVDGGSDLRRQQHTPPPPNGHRSAAAAGTVTVEPPVRKQRPRKPRGAG